MSICTLCCMFLAQPLDTAIQSGLRRSKPLVYSHLQPADAYVHGLVFAELVPHTPHSINPLPFQAEVMENALWAHKILTEVKGELQLEKYSRKSHAGEYNRLLIYKTQLLITRWPRQKHHIGTTQLGLPGPWELALPVSVAGTSLHYAFVQPMTHLLQADLGRYIT